LFDQFVIGIANASVSVQPKGNMMQKVLLATDGSAPAQQAARFLAHLPHQGRLDLTVVSVLTPPYSPMMTMRTDWIELCHEQDREQANKAFAEISDLFDGANASIEQIVVKGNAGDKICELAESRGCDLVVIGAKGHSTVSRILLGSISDFVATHAHCSVLVVRPMDQNRSARPLRIEVGYEETAPAQAALEEITQIAWGSQVEFHVVTMTYTLSLLGFDELTKIRKSGQMVAERLTDLGLNANYHFEQVDHLGEGLVKFAEDHQSDLVVVGETPRSLLGRALMGSTSRYVLRHAPCTVWITRNRINRGLKQVN
jgi:nucleotide-binding universal stress UspA family protein